MPVYVPEKLSDNLYKFAVEVRPCPICGRPMLDHHHSAIYDIRTQAERANVMIHYSEQVVNGHDVCAKCYSQWENENFICFHCKQSYARSEIQETYIAREAAHLCRRCYSTLTAQVWDEVVEEMENACSWPD